MLRYLIWLLRWVCCGILVFWCGDFVVCCDFGCRIYCVVEVFVVWELLVAGICGPFACVTFVVIVGIVFIVVLRWGDVCLIVLVTLICFCFNSVARYLFCFTCGFNCVMVLFVGFYGWVGVAVVCCV